MYLDPAGSGGDVLTMILGPPSLDEAHADGAHLRQFVDGLESVLHGLMQELSELLVVEDLQRTVGRNLADGRGMELIEVVAVARLHEYRRVTQTLCEYLPVHVRDLHA